MKYKLLFVVNLDKFFLSHRLSIAKNALKKGFEVHIATQFTCNIQIIQEMGFKVHPINLDRRSTGLFSNGITFFQLVRLFFNLKPDIVHLVTIKPTLLGGIAAHLTSIPRIVISIPISLIVVSWVIELFLAK